MPYATRFSRPRSVIISTQYGLKYIKFRKIERGQAEKPVEYKDIVAELGNILDVKDDN